MRYQHKWDDLPLDQVPQKNQENLEATIRQSVKLGINHIETARGYGPSERQLGLILPQFPREELIVQTKIAPEEDPAVFISNFEESLERLQLSHVDLLAIHGINNEETLQQSIRSGGCFEAAQRLREQGKVRFIGFSTHAPLPIILRAIQFGEAEVGKGFDYVNLHHYFIFQQNYRAIEEATARDMGVFIISPNDKGGRLYEPPALLTKHCAPLSLMAFNDLWCLSDPKIHTLSLGASKPSDFDEHIKAIQNINEWSPLVETIAQRLEQTMLDRTGFTSPEAIIEGIPEYYDMPQQLNARIMLWLRALSLGWDLHKYSKSRLNLIGNAGHWFPGAKAETIQSMTEEELTPHFTQSPYADRLFAALNESYELLGGETVKRLSQE